MKILMIGPKRIPSREGGIDVVVGKLSEGLVKNGHAVTILVRKKKGHKKKTVFQGCNIKPVFTINKKSTDALVYSFFATLKALFSKADVVHFHAEGNTFFLWMTRFSKKTIVVTCHGIDWKRGKFKGIGTKILVKSEKRIVKYADRIITLCESDRAYFEQTYNKKTALIPNGFEFFPLVPPKLIKEQFNLIGDDYFLFLARIVPEKGLHYLIEAYKNCSLKQKLVIAGGSSHSENYYADMKRMAADNPNIIFTGFVEGRVLEELYSNAYAFVLPSDIEGMPMSLLEALGHRRICLVSDIPENAVDEVNCYYFKKGNVFDLTNKLQELSNNRREFETNNKLISWKEVIAKTESLYIETSTKGRKANV